MASCDSRMSVASSVVRCFVHSSIAALSGSLFSTRASLSSKRGPRSVRACRWPRRRARRFSGSRRTSSCSRQRSRRCSAGQYSDAGSRSVRGRDPSVVGFDFAEEQPPKRFDEGDVDHLALAAPAAADISLEDRHHGGLHRELGRRQVRETDRREQRLAVGKPFA